MNDKIKEVIHKVGKSVNQNSDNKKFIDIITNPWGFHYSTPGKYKQLTAPSNNGETNWQRNLYKKEDYWYDLELPLGQYQNSETKCWSSLRVDLVGIKDSRPIICELKYTKQAGQPYDAILQLLAYYCMIEKNAVTLDQQNIHHANARNMDFKWIDLTNNPILMVRANPKYWENWDKSTPKNQAARRIVEQCKQIGLEIHLYNDDKRIL